jgi:hypothetical protein
MRREAVPAFRERELRRDGSRGAKPPIGAVTQLTDTNPANQERKANTMEIYILRNLKNVEPQKTPRPIRLEPATPANS